MSPLVRVLPGTPALVVDAGGPGRPVVDAMRVAGLKPIAVSITAGKRSRRANGMVHVPRREIVRGPAAAFKNGRLKIARGLPLAGALVGVPGAVYGRGPGYLRRVQVSTTTWLWRWRWRVVREGRLLARATQGTPGAPGACTHIARFGR